MEKMKMRLSTLWIFAILNYLYADVMSTMDPSVLEKLLSGSVGSIQITPGFLLGAAVLMETAIVMVLLSRLLDYGPNRVLNIVAGAIHTAAVASSMFVDGPPDGYYIFFGAIEIGTTIAIIWLAWTWRRPTEAPVITGS